jgi:hypothetical protein
MDIDLTAPLKGQFPYRFTQVDRFQLRRSVQPLVDDFEITLRYCDTRLPALAASRQWGGSPKRTEPPKEVDREDSIRRSVKRAKSQCRKHVIVALADRMFTYTVRLHDGVPPISRALVMKAWALYIKWSKQGDKNFTYVMTVELQKSGQPHVHAAIKGFKNLRDHHRMWNDALAQVMGLPKGLTGSDALGNVDGGVNQYLKKRRSRKDRATKMAAYMAKYMAKDCENVPFNSKRYSHTTGLVVPPKVSVWMDEGDIDAAVKATLLEYGLLLPDGSWPPGVYAKWDSYCAFIVVPHASVAEPPF